MAETYYIYVLATPITLWCTHDSLILDVMWVEGEDGERQHCSCPAPPQLYSSADSIIQVSGLCLVRVCEQRRVNLGDPSRYESTILGLESEDPEQTWYMSARKSRSSTFGPLRLSLSIQSLYTRQKLGFTTSITWIADSRLEGDEDIRIVWDTGGKTPSSNCSSGSERPIFSARSVMHNHSSGVGYWPPGLLSRSLPCL